jgi:amino acid transporter
MHIALRHVGLGVIQEMTSSKPGLFAREATGLVREIGFTLGVIIILTHVIGLGWQKRAFEFSGPMPLPNDLMPLGLPAIFWAFLVCGLIVLITGYTVGWVTSTMPRSGGGYVTISRVLHPFAGYMGGWLMFLAEAFSYGLIGVAVFEGIGIFFGIALSPGTTITWANDASVLFFGGLAIVWIFALLALLGTKMYGRLMQLLFYIPAAITIIFFIMWTAGAMNPTLVSDGFNSVMGARPSTFVSVALDNGMASNIPSFTDALLYAIPGAFWAYMGWYATTFLAGEVKEANKKLPMVLVVAGLITIVVYLTASSLSAITAMNAYSFTDAQGHTWTLFQGYSWLSYGGVDSSAITPFIPNFQKAWSTGIASIVSRGMGLDWLSLLIAVGAVLWVANDIPPFLLVASRTFFAMSFDRMMPERFAYVSEKWHAPVWAIVITAVFAIPACIAESNYLGWAKYLKFAGVVGTDIFDAFFLTLFCVSAMLLPFRRKEIFERSAVKHSSSTIATLGLLSTIGAGFVLWVFLDQSWGWILPGVSGLKGSFGDLTADWSSCIGFFGLIIVGILIYLYYRWKNQARGVDMRTLFLSIPPE